MSNSPQLIAIIGTRAQTIKMAPLLVELERQRTPYRLLMTGQHHETVDSILDEFGVATRRELLYKGPEVKGIAQAGIWMLRTAWRLWRDRDQWAPKPRGAHIVLAHGDTFTTLLAAAIGWLVGCQIAHVEAGLRSFNWRHPFPEELTRVIVSKLARIAYCPGDWACKNLKSDKLNVTNTQANTILDSLRFALEKPASADILMTKPYAVVSVHRFENLLSNERLGIILDTIKQLSKRICVVLVLHPTTEKRLKVIGEFEILAKLPNINMKPRMTYVPFMQLVGGAQLVITDGGSNQEELSYLGIPTLLMRMATERQEGLNSNVILSRFDSELISESLKNVDKVGEGRQRVTLPAHSPAKMIADDLQSRINALRAKHS